MYKMRTHKENSWRSLAMLSALIITLMHSNGAAAAFTDDVAEGVDNNSFTYVAYQDGTDPPFLVANEGVGGGDAIRTGAITQSTFSVSAEGGFFFDFVGPGTLSFQWAVDGQPLVAGIGTLFQYSIIGVETVFITGRNVPFAPVTIDVPAGNQRFFLTYTRSAGSFGEGQDAGWIDQLVWTPDGAPDTTPDPFAFTPQTDIGLSTVTTSNSISISGIDSPSPISISACTGSNCEFSINEGGFTSTPTTVANGDGVRVRQTSSADYATMTTLTLNVGGVTGAFNVTTEDAPEPVVEGPTPTGTGTASAFVEPSGNAEPGCNVSDAAFLNAPEPPPEGVTLPHGLFGFTATGCTSGFSVDVTVNYPDPIPPDANYWKYDPDLGWYIIPATIMGNTVTFTITDNGLGDSDATAGTITDPGGIALGSPIDPGPSLPVPTLSAWQLMLLTAGLAILAAFGLRRQLQ